MKAVNKPRKLQIHKRAEVAGQVLIHDEDHLFIAPLKNLSVGGFFATRLTELEIGKEVRLVVKSSQLQTTVQARGVVVRVHKDDIKGSAVEFTHISPRAKEIIETCIFELKMEGLLKSA